MIEVLTKNINKITAITISEKYIAVARNKLIELWDLKQSKPVKKQYKDENIITNIVINKPNTKLIITSKNQIKVIEILTGKILQSFSIHNSNITAMSLSDKYLITADIDFNIVIWDLKQNELHNLQDSQEIDRIQIIDDKEFITFNKTNKKRWDIEKLELISNSNLKSLTELITINQKNYAFNSDGKFIHFRDIEDDENIFHPNPEFLHKIALNRQNFHTIKINNEYYFASIDKNNIIYLWNINKHQLLKEFVFFNDGNWVAIDKIKNTITGSLKSKQYLDIKYENFT